MPEQKLGGLYRDRIFEAVAKTDGISMPDLAAAVYRNHPDGGPLYANKSIATMIFYMNRNMLGWKIVGTRGRGSLYKLVAKA
jgi:hypothetical protein